MAVGIQRMNRKNHSRPGAFLPARLVHGRQRRRRRDGPALKKAKREVTKTRSSGYTGQEGRSGLRGMSCLKHGDIKIVRDRALAFSRSSPSIDASILEDQPSIEYSTLTAGLFCGGRFILKTLHLSRDTRFSYCKASLEDFKRSTASKSSTTLFADKALPLPWKPGVG